MSRKRMNRKLTTRRARCAALLLLFGVLLRLPALSLHTSAQSAILMEQSTGTVLYAQNADARAYMASTTKIMTALVALDRSAPDTLLIVDDRAVGTEGSSMYLKSGQQVTVRELLTGLMLQSGNDAASALAYHCAGSLEAFAAMMNEKAAALGMSGSHFTNPHGLHDDNHYATAQDMALLSRAALEYPLFCELTSSKFARVGGITVKNHNKMLWIYEGADGVKTGYTQKAGRCLVSSATRDGMRLIAVTLRAPDDWDDHRAMLDHGFEHYTLKTLCRRGDEVCRRPVLGGVESYTVLRAVDDVCVLLPKTEELTVETDVTVPQYFFAPLSGGSELGELRVWSNGKLIGKTALISEHYIAPLTGTKR